jgi:hypothetical protein
MRLLIGLRASEPAPGELHCISKIVEMPKRTPKRGRSAPDDFPALPLPDPDEESSSVAKINKWITLADIALGQGIGRKIA